MWGWEVAIPKQAALVPSVSATSWRRGHGICAKASQQGGKLGETLLASLQWESSGIGKAQDEGEISGSDVLWALQRASARKKKKKKEHRRGLSTSSVPTPTQETTPDYTNVRPLRINANWSAKLDQFHKRLRQLSDTI